MSKRRENEPFFYIRRSAARSIATRIGTRTLAFFGVMIVLIGIAGWLYLHQASEVAAYAHEIRQLEHEKERLRREIVALRADVAALGSLEHTEAIGEELGYTLPSAADGQRFVRVEYVSQPTPTPAATPEPEDGESRARAVQTLLRRVYEPFVKWIQSPTGSP